MSTSLDTRSAAGPNLDRPGIPMPRRDTPGGSDRYLTFALGRETYALDIRNVTEIMEFRSLTDVPMMPPFIRGVINLRGRVVPVVDLAARLGRGSTDVARRTSIIIVEASQTEGGNSPQPNIGIMVDAVNKVAQLQADDIEPPPALSAGIGPDFISGMAKHDGEFIIVLDVSRMLDTQHAVSLDPAAHERVVSAPLTPAAPAPQAVHA